VISLTMVASVLIYIYPLRVIFTAFVANASGGAIAAGFPLTLQQIGMMFVVFGIGFSLLAGLLTTLHARALYLHKRLMLSALECLETRNDMITWGVVALTGMASTVMALLLPEDITAAAGYVYWSLVFSMPLMSWLAARRRRLLASGQLSATAHKLPR